MFKDAYSYKVQVDAKHYLQQHLGKLLSNDNKNQWLSWNMFHIVESLDEKRTVSLGSRDWNQWPGCYSCLGLEYFIPSSCFPAKLIFLSLYTAASAGGLETIHAHCMI